MVLQHADEFPLLDVTQAAHAHVFGEETEVRDQLSEAHIGGEFAQQSQLLKDFLVRSLDHGNSLDNGRLWYSKGSGSRQRIDNSPIPDGVQSSTSILLSQALLGAMAICGGWIPRPPTFAPERRAPPTSR